MQDQYTGEAGTFVNDPETGTRMPQAEWEAKQASKVATESASTKPQAKTIKPTEEQI